MRQMLLGLEAVKPQTLDNFVSGTNHELMQLLTGLAAANRAAEHTGERFIYLWGEPGAGKTHLLRALANQPAARYIAADAGESVFLFDESVRLYLLDDCDKLSAASQVAAFALFNQVREHGAVMVSAGAVAPAGLALREDLRTRLGWGLIYQVHPLTDEEKISALTQAAAARGVTLSPGVIPYLITHFRRDMRSLVSMLDALDTYSLETKRPMTLPLLRELLQLESEPT
ncbi:MAG: DnaA regulatory inactivator Hda [Burkholderiaceae bacterium]|nr:DnaA regulatory inactivator Hda [Burkholderiaceae bacterium]